MAWRHFESGMTQPKIQLAECCQHSSALAIYASTDPSSCSEQEIEPLRNGTPQKRMAESEWGEMGDDRTSLPSQGTLQVCSILRARQRIEQAAACSKQTMTPSTTKGQALRAQISLLGCTALKASSLLQNL